MKSQAVKTRRFRCWVCSHTSESQIGNVTHIRMCHMSRDTPYRCMACGERFREAPQLNAHVDTHSSPPGPKVTDSTLPFGCHLCSRRFPTANGVVLHRLQTHDRLLKRFLCTFCKEDFSSETELLRHTTLQHSRALLRECARGPEEDSVPLPSKEEDGNPLGDTPSPEQYASKRGKFQCLKCRKAFHNFDALRYHLIYH